MFCVHPPFCFYNQVFCYCFYQIYFVHLHLNLHPLHWYWGEGSVIPTTFTPSSSLNPCSIQSNLKFMMYFFSHISLLNSSILIYFWSRLMILLLSRCLRCTDDKDVSFSFSYANIFFDICLYVLSCIRIS